MRETGEPVPDPSTLDDVMSNPDFRDGVGFPRERRRAGQTVRVNITLTEQELHEIGQLARAAGDEPLGILVRSGLNAS